MEKKYSLFIIILLLITSCGSANDNAGKEVLLFNDTSVKLLDGENVLKSTLALKNEYEILMENKKLKVPLFKSIDGGNYKVFVGLPYSTTIELLANDSINSKEFLISSKNKFPKSFYRLFFEENLYVVEYAQEAKGNILYFVGKTTSEELSEKLFSEDEIANRVVTNE